MYINFDEYPRYSGRVFGIFEKYVNEDIKCEHGGLHPITARKGKYIPVNVYISMKYELKIFSV